MKKNPHSNCFLLFAVSRTMRRILNDIEVRETTRENESRVENFMLTPKPKLSQNQLNRSKDEMR
jgi:hypothetical protein